MTCILVILSKVTAEYDERNINLWEKTDLGYFINTIYCSFIISCEI